MRWRHAAVAAAVVAVAAGAWWLQRGGGDAGVERAPQALIPAGAGAWVALAPLASLADGVAEIAGGLQGSGDLAAAAGAWLGLPRLDHGALADAGYDGTRGAACFAWEGALWCALPSGGPRAIGHLREAVARRGAQVVAWGREGWRSADGALAARQEPGGIVLLRVALPRLAALGRTVAPPVDAASPAPPLPQPATAGGSGSTAGPAGQDAVAAALEAAWLRLSEQPPASIPPLAAGVAAKGRVELGDGDHVRPALRAALGPAALLFGRAVDLLRAIDVELRDLGRHPTLRLRGSLPEALATELANYHQGFLADAAALDLGPLLPDELAVWTRARVNPVLLDMVPGFLRDRLLPTSLLGRIDPALAVVDARALLLQAWDGQLAAGVLGLDDALPLHAGLLADLDGVLRGLGGFVALGMRPDSAARLHDAIVGAWQGAARGPGVPVTLGSWRGTSWDGPGTPLTLLYQPSALVVLWGHDELPRWQRVASGRLPNAAAAAVGRELAILRGHGQWWSVASTPGRIVRAARRRGVPEHFVRMLASVAAAHIQAGLAADGVHLEIALRPRSSAPEGR